MRNKHNESAISLSITRQHKEEEDRVNKRLELDDKGREFFYVKINLAEEIGLVKKLHRFFHEKTGGYITRSSFITYLIRLGLSEALDKKEELSELDKVLDRHLNRGMVK